MNNKQIFNPKYWMLHNKESDDVYIDTADKSLQDSRVKAAEIYPKEFMEYMNSMDDSDCPYEFDLFEISICIKRPIK